MQTFLPYANYNDAAAALDYRRLGKQRVEAWQILNTLRGVNKGWATHPAVLMWRGHELSLAYYGLTMCEQWRDRGYTDNMSSRFISFINNRDEPKRPPWINSINLQITHRGMLYHKDPNFYAQFEPEAIDQGFYVCCATCDYWWPTHDGYMP